MASSERRGKLNIETRLQSDRLSIIVNDAKGLSPMDANGKSDPYVRVSTINPSGGSGACKSKIKK